MQAYKLRNILNFNFCETRSLALRKVRRLSAREQGAKKVTYYNNNNNNNNNNYYYYYYYYYYY